MKLCAQWIHASRPHDEKVMVELIGRNAILDFFNGVENAKKAYEFYQSNPHRPSQDWPRAYHYAFRQAASKCSAWEKSHTQIKFSFKEGLKNDH